MRYIWSLVLSVFVVINQPCVAQAVVIRSASVAQSAANELSRKGLDAMISVNLDDVPLQQALRTIARQGNLYPAFGDRVQEVQKRVTLRLDNITIADALRQALKGTEISFSVTATRQLLFTHAVSGRLLRAGGVISGKVTDGKTGKGISGASISLGNDTRGVVTDEDGLYRLAGIAVGTHTISVRLVGYAKQTRQVVVGEGIAVSVDFKLEPSASVLDQVVVTGTVVATELRSVPNAITVITAKQIEERGITRIDQLFRGDIPGLFSLNLGAVSALDEVTMFSRGATALSNSSSGTSSISTPTSNTFTFTNPIKTYIDGVEMADSKYLSQIDPSSIERIEILAGPQASTIYGSNAINGVMQIFTKRGASNRPQITLNLTSGVAQNNFSSHLAPSHIADVRVSGTENRWSYNVGSSWSYAGSWTPAKQTQRFSANGGGKMDFGKFTADLSTRQGLTKNKQRGNINSGQGVIELRAIGVYSPFTVAPTPQTSTLNGQTFGLSLSFRPFSWWSHDVGLGSDASTAETIKTTPQFGFPGDTTLSINTSTISRVSQRYTTTMQLHLSSFSSLNLTFGGDHWRTSGSSSRAFPVSLLTGNLANPSVTRDAPDKNSGAFVQGQLSIYDALFFTYGVRADWNPNFGDKAKVKPGRYGVSYTRDIATHFGPMSAKFRGSYGSSIRPPSEGQKLATAAVSANGVSVFGPFDATLANPNLVPENQQGGEGGVELYFGSRASLVVTRYNQTVDNLISLVGSFSATSGLGLDSVRSLSPQPTNQIECSSSYRDVGGYCYKYQQQFLNVGSIRNQGWEMTSSVTLGPLTTRGTYSWVKSRVIGVTPKYRAFLTSSTFQPGRPFNFLPEHTWALGLAYAHSASSLSLSINGISMRYKANNTLDPSDALSLATNSSNRLISSRVRMDTPSGYRSIGSGYATVDLNTTHRFSSRLDAVVQIINLTNYYQNDISASYASMGRQTKAGFKLRL